MDNKQFVELMRQTGMNRGELKQALARVAKAYGVGVDGWTPYGSSQCIVFRCLLCGAETVIQHTAVTCPYCGGEGTVTHY